MKKRASGVLMHITSLPGKQGVGTFGQEAYDFVDFLVETDQTYWQILPLTTTSYGDSPYQSFSATAGNTHLIDLELLSEQGYLDKKDFETVNFGDDLESVDYARIFELRRPILEKAVKAFLSQKENIEALAEFEKDTSWLQDFADFIAIKEFFDNKALQEWDDKAVVRREEKALETYRAKLKTLFFTIKSLNISSINNGLNSKLMLMKMVLKLLVICQFMFQLIVLKYGQCLNSSK